MKNSNSLTNYSILVLVLLVLILIYIHIPNPQIIMRGGASSDIQNMINNDKIYSNTLGHPIIQWVILVVFIILIYFAYVSSINAFAWTGAPVLGINGLVDTYTISGPGFLKKFYQLTQDTLVFKNGIGGSDPLYPEDMETYKNNIVDFKTSMKTHINIFCNEAVKCNPCECPGAMEDPSVNEQCKPNIKNEKGGKQAVAMMAANKDAADKFMGFIPKCCCLTKIQKGDYKYVENESIGKDFTNTNYWASNDVKSANLTDTSHKTYKWKDGNSSLLKDGSADSSAKLHGCDVSGGSLKDSSDKLQFILTKAEDLTKDEKNPCVCPDGDPTLNYYNYNKDMTVVEKGKLKISPELKLKVKANLFATWAKNETGSNVGNTEKSYRVKPTDDAAKLYEFPESYYTNKTKTTFKPECLVDGYILAGTKDGDKIVCDTSKWPDTLKSNEKAKYMIDKHKFFYHLPNSTFSKPSLFEPSEDFSNSIKTQMEAIKNSDVPKDGFFGGIYNYVFSVKK